VRGLRNIASSQHIFGMRAAARSATQSLIARGGGMTDDSGLANHLESLQRDLAQLGRWMVIVIRFLDAALAALLAIGTYLAMDSWDAYEFWSRSFAITVFVVAYMLLDKIFVQSVPLRALFLAPLQKSLNPAGIALRPELPHPDLAEGQSARDADAA
jgi:hypothetical protein